MQPRSGVPRGDLGSPGLEVGPNEIAQLADFELGVELGAQIHEVKGAAQVERDDEVLADRVGDEIAGVFFGEALFECEVVAGSGVEANVEIDAALFGGCRVNTSDASDE